MSKTLPYQRQARVFYLLGFLLVLSTGLTLTRLAASAESAAAPAVTYDMNTNTIFLGSTSGTAASEVINLPALAATLAAQGHAGILTDQGSGIWLLKASILIQQTAKLEITKATVNWLRLESPPLASIRLVAARQGYLLVDGIKLTSWDSATNAPDENLANGRAYLLAFEGGRMDLLNSELAYLGWESGEGSGLSWRKRYTPGDPTTGATGRLEDSQIHHNYFGMYSYEAYGITILRNEVYENIEYGIDPHDDSRQLEVAYNRVYKNGNHGIIFSRLCQDNTIHHNEVFDNALHGIMLDRGSNNNTVYDNVVYNNQDGIAIFQSSNNLIQNNYLYNNRRGMRINATFIPGDAYDGVTSNNQFVGNRIEDSSEHGIYLYARADRNLFTGNTILRSGVNGIYIKSGGNRFDNNLVQGGVNGFTISGGEYLNDPPEALDPLDPPGYYNVVISNTVTANSGVGIRILGGSGNQIGPSQPAEQPNRIIGNGLDGLSIADATNGAISTDNQVLKNIIHSNTRHGILIKDATTIRNRISQNSITNNGQRGIRIDGGAQQGILPPVMGSVSAQGVLQGTAKPNATIELYADPGDSTQRVLDTVTTFTTDNPVSAAAQPNAVAVIYAAGDLEGRDYLGSATANSSGAWSFQLPTGQAFAQVTALAIDTSGNSSAFSSTAQGIGPFFTVAPDDNGQPTIQVNGSAIQVTLATIQTGLGAEHAQLLQNLGNGIWLLNANLFIGPNVTLDLSRATGVNELRLRSQASVSGASVGAAGIDYASFVYLRTHSGVINMDGVKVYSWDAAANGVDQDSSNGRAYVIAKYAAALNIYNAELSYLGSADGESYGVSWRDVNESATPNVLRSRVTGEVINSQFHHNYYGIYTYQASDMLFRGNQFHSNIRYGFDPHDFTHDVLVENNVAYNNGSHGFIISRGCNNFVIRNNQSYNNSDPSPTSLGHGFMLDPGSPNATDPQAPSFDNILEGNEAYNNEGYGLRVLGSNNNQILNNRFYQNQQEGLVIDQGSVGNTVAGNTISQNVADGLDVRETADRNIIANNTISENGVHGIYVRSNGNQVLGNLVSKNLKTGIAFLPAMSIPSLQENQLLSNTVSQNGENGIDLRKALKTLVEGNLSESNGINGLYLSDTASQNGIVRNILRNNTGHGIRANGIQTLNNAWSENSIYGNLAGGIANTSGANVAIAAPQLLSVVEHTVTGKAIPGVTVEIFSDQGQQGQSFEGRAVADANGDFSLTVAGTWRAANLTAVTIDALGNASVFSAAITVPLVATPTPTGPPT
ncbi:MAG: right-handed parallel beta-helix repeat-containing protein, partial [Caldilineaceae bacterium]|nr:right-handed parallel beta-helix repeat-containing protein [Caldilineaceae bacterium]